MTILDKLYAYIMNHFIPKERQFDEHKITCTVDDIPVNCETWEENKDN